jgi:hypothetical protein
MRIFPLQHTSGRFSLVSPAAFFGGCLIAVVVAFSIPLLPAFAATGPFADFTGNWSGTGTLQPQGGAIERIRCLAKYRPRGSSQREIDLELRCASDSYNFDLSGQFTADEKNQITGRWTERSRNVVGSALGRSSSNRIDIHAESSAFSADLGLVTSGRRQSVTIESHGGGQVVKATISLTRN